MNTLLKLEDLAKLTFAFGVTLFLGFKWWMFFAFLLVPDVSMIGYLLNARWGAYLYNLGHHQAIALLVVVLGYYSTNLNIQFAGWIMFGHSAMDRCFGYGLKYTDDFKNTHLGRIGRN
jgi:hypothetical protein